MANKKVNYLPIGDLIQEYPPTLVALTTIVMIPIEAIASKRIAATSKGVAL